MDVCHAVLGAPSEPTERRTHPGAELSRAGKTVESMADWTSLDEKLAALFGSDLLAIYLQDHLAGASFGLELARRSCGANAGTEVGEFLERLVPEIEADRAALESLMARLGVRPDSLKAALAWATEKAGRLKRNGRFVSYSPLSRVIELEGLIGGVTGKLALWRALRAVADGDERLDAEQLERLIGRAESQIADLFRHQRAAAELALSR
jgi:hypothetical protein